MSFNWDDTDRRLIGNEAMDQASEPFRGVRRSRNKWRAVISVDGQSVNLGIFDTKEQAAEVCRAAECQNAERKRNALICVVLHDTFAFRKSRDSGAFGNQYTTQELCGE